MVWPKKRPGVYAVEMIYILSWKSLADQDLARQIVDKKAGGTSILSPEEGLRLILTKQDGPVMVFHNAVNDPSKIIESLKKYMKTDRVFQFPVTPFQGTRQLIGGLSPGLEPGAQAQVREALGMIPQMIEAARLDPDQPVLAVLDRFSHQNPQIPTLLNGFFQKGRLDDVDEWISAPVAEGLIARIAQKPGLGEKLLRGSGLGDGLVLEKLDQRQQIEFAKWFYGHLPSNLRFVPWIPMPKRVIFRPLNSTGSGPLISPGNLTAAGSLIILGKNCRPN